MAQTSRGLLQKCWVVIVFNSLRMVFLWYQNVSLCLKSSQQRFLFNGEVFQVGFAHDRAQKIRNTLPQQCFGIAVQHPGNGFGFGLGKYRVCLRSMTCWTCGWSAAAQKQHHEHQHVAVSAAAQSQHHEDQQMAGFSRDPEPAS